MKNHSLRRFALVHFVVENFENERLMAVEKVDRRTLVSGVSVFQLFRVFHSVSVFQVFQGVSGCFRVFR